MLVAALTVGLLPVVATAAETADHVVINQVYGGGGNSGAKYKNDFIELYNPTDQDVSLDGWSVQYASNKGSSFSGTTELSGSIKAHGYYLIQEKAGSGGNGEALPGNDIAGEIDLAAKNFTVALVSSTTTLDVKNKKITDTSTVVDLVGAGTAAIFDRTAAPAASNSTSIIRKVDGVDTDDNGVDFKTKTPTPRCGTPVEPPAVAKPVAAPASGSTVVQGTTVNVTCSTDGATLEISTDGGTNWTALTSPITLNTVGSYTAKVRAVKDTNVSEVLDLTYTVVAPETPPAEGSKVVLYYTKGNLALTAIPNSDGKKLTGVKGTVEGDKLTTTTEAAVLTVGKDGEYYTFTCDNKYLTSGATGSSLTLAETANDYSKWALEPTVDGFFIRNANAKYTKNGIENPQYMEYFSGFTTYSMNDSEAYKFTFRFFDEADVTLNEPEKPDTPDPGPDQPGETATLPADGEYVIWAESFNQAVSSTTNSKDYFLGEKVEAAEDGVLYGPAETAVWTVKRTDTTGSATSGTYTIEQGGKYLGADDAKHLTWMEAPTSKEWTVEVNKSTLNMKCGGKYLKWDDGYSDWTLSGTSTSEKVNDFTFTPKAMVQLPEVSIYTVDPDVEAAVAVWGGSTPEYDNLADKTVIRGDLYKSSDMRDAKAEFSAVANGQPAQAYQKTSTQTGGYNYYMGAENVGAKTGDYAQLAVNTAGYADMELSFRIRATGSAPGSFQLKYSADGGKTFKKFTTGAYSYSYTRYENNVPVETKEMSDSISDGQARTSLNPGEYITFTFDVPAGAENQENLLIRLMAGSTKANGKDGMPSGNIRVDSVTLSGYPIVHDKITSYVAVEPDNEEDRAPGTPLTLTCATAGAAISYRFVDPDTGVSKDGWKTYDAAAKPVLPALPAVLEAKASAAGKADGVTRVWVYAAGTVSNVKMTPNGGGVFIPAEETSVQVNLSCDTAGATIYFSLDGEKYEVYDPAKPIVLEKGFGTKTVWAYATLAGFADSAVTTRTFTERAKAEYSLFFGQLHSHTSYSDGAGTCAEAFTHAKGLDAKWNIDFLAVTDHSNSFDGAESASLADGSMSEEWKEGHTLADAATGDGFTGIYGFEMTWSNGLGHINTFNTPGFQSRTQGDYSTYNTALQNYYTTLKTQSNSISQFNHPGTTFGDFSDFAHYDEEIDNLITLIEVGNGEGAIGSSGYFPSYEYYTRALDKGWHVAPTNNQDNHKGNWGDSNNGRSVVVADDLSRESIYDAMRNYRVYATEDLNLEIRYTLDGSIMGSILDGASGENAVAKVELNDPDDTGVATVQVIVNGGLVAKEVKTTCDKTVELTVPSKYAYYYIKVIQADGDIAVTAPVWLGKVEAVGVGSMTAASDLTVAGQEQTITLELYNNEKKRLEVESITFTDKETGEVLATDHTITRVNKLSTASCVFKHTFQADGVFTVVATVKGTLGGVEKTYTKELELTVMPADIVRTVVVDGTHYNDYVTGYYGGNMGNMTSIAADVGVQVNVVGPGKEITADMLKNCALLVISAPARKNASEGPYEASTFEDSFIDLVKNYVANGGKVVVCGLADYQDKNAKLGAEGHAAAQLNKLLAAIGSTMTVNDDEVIDEVTNGGQPYRLYPEIFNMESQWTKGIVNVESVGKDESYQTYSQYSGCSVNPGSGTWLVKGFGTTWGADSDRDKVGVIPDVKYTYEFGTKEDGSPATYTYDAVVDKGDVVFLAAESVGKGTVFAAGGVFLSNFEVKAELDNIWDLPYANRTIYENILKAVRADVPPTPIADIRKAPLNRVFVAEGYVTSGTDNKNTTFFDAIYIQDDTGGITVFPYSVEGLAIGTKVQIIGYTDAYQGDKELQITSLQVLEGTKTYQPKALSTKDAADYDAYGGQLVKTEGKVSDIVKSGGVVSQFKLTDDSGVAATVFIDGYITSPKGENTISSWIKNGDTVSAVGLSYLHPEGSSDVSVPVLRVRNCDEVVLIAAAPVESAKPSSSTKPAAQTTVEEKEDGSVVTTVTDASGAVTETTVYPDGKKVENVTTAEGDKAITVVDADGETVAELNLPAVLTWPAETYDDVPEDHWAKTGIYNMTILGAVKGVGGNKFDMVSPMTRGALATVFHRLSSTPAGGEVTFEDVAKDTYYTQGVAWAAKVGVVKGVSPDSFLPDEAITREQLAVMICRYAQLLGQDTTAKADALDAFQDSGEAGGWAVDSLAWCVEKGVIQGKGGQVLDPLASVTRAEAATMVNRLITLLYTA